MFLDTDQIKCYNSSGAEVTCRHSGQDAAYKQGPRMVAADTARWLDGKDTVEDKLTGLVWPKRASLSTLPLSWQEALDFAAQLSGPETPTAGNWRLPTRRELFTLLSHQQVNPALPAGHPFEDVFNGYYWTQTPCARLPDQAWYIHLGGGKIYRGMQHGSYMVWPVAGQGANPAGGDNRFTTQGDTVYDSATARHWFTGRGLREPARTWEAALGAVHDLNCQRESGCHDWRLPNIRELESLVDDRRHSSALALGILAGSARMTGFWSSTTSVYEPRYAWVLYPQDGALGVGYKTQADFHTLAVRG